MRSSLVARASLVLSLLIMSVGSSGGQEPRRAPTPRGRIAELPAQTELAWPLPAGASKAYDAIDGRRMKGYVEEMAAISRRYRDAGNQYWGRLVGTSSMDETQQWVANKFRQAGLEVQMKEYPLNPQVFPRSWDITVNGAGKTLKLTSASPLISFAQYIPSTEGDMELDTAWVGLGMA